MQALLFDLDGVVYQDGKAISGAVDTLQWVRDANIPHLFVTNTTSRPRSGIQERLQSYGLDISADSILTPAVAACGWLREHHANNVALFVPDATANEFSDFPVLAAEAKRGADAVIVGDLGEGWDFARLNRAFRLLSYNPDCALLALGMTRYWRAPEGLRLDTGPFVRALEYASEREAVVLGKPAADFFAIALERLGCTAHDTLMIGDDVRADIGGAQASGLKAALVRTGKFQSTDLEGQIKPDTVLDSIADLHDWWEKQ
ncbi:MAG: TIGR01458 family HAD-type hydrolase [Gammaproteobacteria bacterium]